MTNPETSVLAGLLRDAMVAGQMPFLTVSSASMAPLLRVGDEVGIQPVALSQLRIGDVVVVCHQQLILTHRFCGRWAGKSDDTFVTRGDRSRMYDSPWTESQLLGRVVARRRQKQLLWLDFGPGRWLSRRLAVMAQVEQKALKRWPFAEAQPQKSRTPQMVRITFRALASLLTQVVEKGM